MAQGYKMKEKEWVERLIKGDEDAFGDLYSAYKNRLMFFALQMLKSKAFAEDVFQDTFAAVWRNRLFLDPTVPFGPYVYTIMRNRILNLLADIDKDERLQEVLMKGAIDSGDNTPVDHVLSDDLFGLLEETLKQLPSQQQKVFRLSREEYLSHKEIAERLDISVNTVQQHISEVLKKLRFVLEKKADIYLDIVLLLYCLNAYGG